MNGQLSSVNYAPALITLKLKEEDPWTEGKCCVQEDTPLCKGTSFKEIQAFVLCIKVVDVTVVSFF